MRRFSIALFALVIGLSAARQAAASPCTATAYSLNAAPPASSNWSDLNWTPTSNYPGSSTCDSASDAQASSHSILVNGSTLPLNPIMGVTFTCPNCILDIQSGGTLTLAADSSFSGSAALQVSGGNLVVQSGVTLTIQSGSLFHLTAGTISGGGTIHILSGGSLTFDSASSPALDNVTIKNDGTVNLTPGGAASLAMTNGAVINNNNNMYLGSNLTSISAGAGVNIINNGSYLQSSGTTTVFPQFNNLASSVPGVSVAGGKLSLAGGGQGDAPFSLTGTLDIPSNSYTLGTNGVVSGGGTLSIDGGTLSIGGVTSPGGFAMSSGTLDGDGFLTVSSNFDWSGGTIKSSTGNGGTQIAGTGVGTFSGANGDMTLDNRRFDDYGYVHYTATTNELYLTNGAMLSIYGTFEIQDNGSLKAGGATSTINVSPNGVLMKTGGILVSTIEPAFNNNSTVWGFIGTLNIAGDGTSNGNFGAFTPGTIEFSANSTTLTNNSQVFGTGKIAFAAGMTVVGGFFGMNSLTMDALTDVCGGSVEVDSDATTNVFKFTSGTLTVDGSFTLTNSGTWSGGTLGGLTGSFFVANGATLTIDALTGFPIINDGEIFNDGTLIYNSTTNPLELDNGADIYNNTGLFDIQTDVKIIAQTGVIVLGHSKKVPTSVPVHRQHRRVARNAITALCGCSPVVFNLGTLKKSAGALTIDFQPELDTSGTFNLLSGTMQFDAAGVFQAGGTTTLGPGNIKMNGSPYTLTLGTFQGAGTLTGDLKNVGGNVAPGGSAAIGTINVTGNYTQGASPASLNIELASPSSYDVLAVGGNTTLDGILNVSLINSYQPLNGATFQPLTFATKVSDFATKNLPTWAAGHGSFTPTYPPNALLLTAVVTPQSADLAAGMTGTPPTTVNAGQPLSYGITITNNGPDATSGTITVVDTLPAGATGASGSNTGGWSCGAPSGGTITCTNGTSLAVTAQLPALTISMTAPANGGGVTNSATVSAVTGDPNNANNTASVSTTVVAQADLSIVKSGPNGVTAGQNIVYTIVVTNNGPSSSTGVTVTDPTPAGLTFVSNSGACTSAFPCNLGTLTSAQSATITATYSTPGTLSGNVINTATVSSTGTPDPNNANDSSSKTTNVGAQADLSITKTGPASANTGQNISYTIVVNNAGPSPAANTVVSDPTPVGLAFVSNTGACTSAYPCNVGTINSGQTLSITSTYTIPGNYSSPQINNTANVSTSTNDPNAANNASTANTNVALAADVTITKTGPTTASAGSNVTYAIVTTNAGPSAAAAVVVSDPTPAGVTFVSNTGGCTSAFPCNLGNMTPGQTVTINATFNIPFGFSGPSFTNTATVASGANDPQPSNNTSSVTTTVTPAISQADLSITKNGPASISVGQNIVYTTTVTNAGPLIANGTVVTDPTPAGLTFVSNSGACTSAFPCNLGTLNVGQSATITSTYTVPANYPGASITNTASASTTTSETTLTNNTATATTTIVGAAGTDVSVNKYGPANAGTGGLVDFVIDVFNNGPALAANVILADPTPSGLTFVSNSGACTTPYPCALGSLSAGSTRTVISRYLVTAPSGSTITNTANVSTTTIDTNNANNSSQASVRIVPCPTTPPQIVTPANGSTTSSPVHLSWSTVAGASYVVTITGTSSTTLPVTSETSVDVILPVGSYSWTVRANFANGCPSLTSTASAFTVCIVPDAPLASAVGELTTGQTFRVEWAPVGNATAYELQEAGDAAFTNPTIFAVNGTSRDFTKVATNATAFFYRVRAISTCGQSPFSPTVSVVVIPVPKPTDPRYNVIVPNGSVTPVVFQIFIPGLPNGPVSFIATADRPWLAVVPQAGIVPPEGTLLTISVDPGTLVNGTWTGTILIVYNIPASGKTAPNASQTTSIPVSISLVTPITPGKLPGPTANTLIIPTVGHLFGVDSQWQSDIRIANLTSSKANYLVSFNSGSGNPSVPTKQTTLTIDPGATTALDDIVRQWFGVGSLGDSANGILFVQALDAVGRPLSGPVPNDVSINKTVAVSSRTYNTTANATSPGTLGQFVPATAFANFIGRVGGGAVSSIVSLQQIAQTDAFRTNLGLVEAAGKATSLKVGVFDATGGKLLELPFSLAAGQQLQLNAFLAQNNISVTNGRLQVEVTSGDGRVQSYASVIDTKTGDPFLVSGTLLGSTASNYVVPGVGDLNTGNASWRTDVRIFNAGAAPQTTTLTYYPNGDPSNSTSKSVAINPGEVKALDSVVQSLFGLSNTSGALHVTTPTESPLVITARTFDQTPSGTLGQFIPAVTNNDAVGRNDRSLQVLQAEESVHYRTNLGIAEVTGKAVTVEVSVFLPDSKVVPHVTLSLAANESRQIPILSSLGIGATYNARLSVRVTDGDGKVTAYGSVVDMATQAPTFIPAQ